MISGFSNAYFFQERVASNTKVDCLNLVKTFGSRFSDCLFSRLSVWLFVSLSVLLLLLQPLGKLL
jgi:hypothetical protein